MIFPKKRCFLAQIKKSNFFLISHFISYISQKLYSVMLSKTKTSAKNKKVVVKKVTKKPSSVDVSIVNKAVSNQKSTKSKNEIKEKTSKKDVVNKKAVSKKVATVKAEVKKVVKKSSNTVTPSLKENVKKKMENKVTVKKVEASADKKGLKTEKTTKPNLLVNTSKPTPSPKKEKPSVSKKTIVAPTTYSSTNSNQASKVSKEPAGKFEMEFVIKASEDMVFEFVSTESGLSEWFCDDVNIKNNIFTFNWDGQIQQARLVKEVPPAFIRYQWLDKEDGSYFEFRIEKDELTNDISLIITDFASDKNDEISSKLLWHSQVDKLLHVLGSFF